MTAHLGLAQPPKVPVMQAGMGGGLSGRELAAAVSRAGGLGTLGLMPPTQFASELRALRDDCAGAPFAANLLMPFVRRAHVDACVDARPAVVTLFFGFDDAIVARLKAGGSAVWHQVGTVEQARRAIAGGADGLIAQGSEAGGHLAGTAPLAALVPAVREVAGGRPVLAAGGIHDAASARAARALGAAGVVAGTRFLLTPESDAHDDYKARLLAADRTVRTQLFGLAWPADHRVVPNVATERWGDGPRWAAALNALMVPTRRLLPMASVIDLVRWQRVGVPVYTPAAVTRAMDPRLLDVTPLYAGECVARIKALKPAADVVAELGRGFAGSG